MEKEYYPLVTTLLSDGKNKWLFDLLNYKSDSFFYLYSTNQDDWESEIIEIFIKYEWKINTYSVYDKTYDSCIFISDDYKKLFYFFNTEPFFDSNNDNYDDILLSKMNKYDEVIINKIKEHQEKQRIKEEENDKIRNERAKEINDINEKYNINYNDYNTPENYFWEIYHMLKDFVENKYNNYWNTHNFNIKYVSSYISKNFIKWEIIIKLEREEKYCYYDKYNTWETDENWIYLDKYWNRAKEIFFYMKSEWKFQKYKETDIMYATNSLISYLEWKNIIYIN